MLGVRYWVLGMAVPYTLNPIPYTLTRGSRLRRSNRLIRPAVIPHVEIVPLQAIFLPARQQNLPGNRMGQCGDPFTVNRSVHAAADLDAGPDDSSIRFAQ